MSRVIQWINEKIINNGTNRIDANDIDEIRDFALLWNLFEDICCKNNASMPKLESLVDTHISRIDEDFYKDIFQYFYQRYQDDEKLQALNLRAPQKMLATNILNNTFTDKNNKLKFIMSVIYRYRNNLFHGEKNMRYISLQKENFKKTNEFLMKFIEMCRSN